MIIKIHQALHGYKEGHQLLATSADLSIEARKTLLFQSDLSGPIIYKGFETYLTGYQLPDSKYYAFAKTWYANEMPRPGCVWTHTLLIEFVDVGKIVDFESLVRFFRRPEQNYYQEYDKPVEAPFNSLNVSLPYNRDFYDEIANAIYAPPYKTVVIPADTSEKFQTEILRIWSDQWPRLRRSFAFCTGTMSAKSIRGKSFDLQIVPSIISLRQFENNKVIRLISIEESKADWLTIIHEENKNEIRSFFWIFGADIEGKRSNYRKILNLYKLLTKELSIAEIGDAIKVNIPNPNEGKSIKQSLFNTTQLANFSEYEILSYLTTTADIEYLPISEYKLTERLAKAVNEKQITFYDGCRLLLAAQPQRISDEIWDLVEYNFTDSVIAIGLDEVIADKILSRNLTYCGETAIWQNNSHTSDFAFKWVIKNYPKILPDKYLNAALKADSGISALMLDNYRQDIVPNILVWRLESSNNIPKQVAERIAKQYRQSLIAWVGSRIPNVPSDILVLLFDYGTAHQSFELPFTTEQWLEILKRLDEDQPVVLPIVYTVVLSIGFHNRIHKAELLVARSFSKVFEFTAKSQLGEIWEILPQDLEGFNDDDEFSIFDAFLSLFRINPSKKRYQIPSWDHCELLIVTYVHRFIKCNWSLQGFIDGLSYRVAFERAMAYSVTFKRGREYITTIIHYMDVEKIRCFDFQRNILNAIKNESRQQ